MTTPIVPSISDEQLAELERYYTPEPIPPCCVCGSPLVISAIGGGEPTTWNCSAELQKGGRFDWDHYGKSTFKQRRSGDGRVVALIARLRAAEADAKRYRWLRDPERMPADDPHGHLIVGEADGEDIHWRESLDNAIDRAMERTP